MTDWAVVIVIGFVLFCIALIMVWLWWFKKYVLAGSGGLMLIGFQYNETVQMIGDTILLPFTFMKE